MVSAVGRVRSFFVCLVLVLAWAGSSAAFAAPARPKDSQIKKDKKGKDVVKIELRPGGGVSLEDGVWIFEQTVYVHYKTQWKGVTKISSGDVVYQYEGRKWRYVRTRPSAVWYEGFSPPTVEDAKIALASGAPLDFFGNHLHAKLIELHSIKLADDPKLEGGLDSGSFRAIGEYSIKPDPNNGKTIIRELDEFAVTLSREGPETPWTGLCKTKSCVKGVPLRNSGKAYKKLKEDTHSDNVKIRTLEQQAEDAWVEAKLAPLKLPASWKSLEDFASSAYKVLYSGDEDTWKAFLYRTKYDDNVFKWGVDIFVRNSQEIRAQFCPELLFYETSGNPTEMRIKFMDKGQKKTCNLTVRDFNGYSVSNMSCEATRGPEAEAIAKISVAEGCKDPRAAKAKAKAANAARLGIAVGDKVISKWRGSGNEYKAVIKDIEGDKVFVHYDEDDAEEWVPATSVRKRDVSAKPVAPAKGAAFAVGDKVMAKWHGNSKEYPGKIAEIKGDKVHVHYDDGDKEWLPATAVRKR